MTAQLSCHSIEFKSGPTQPTAQNASSCTFCMAALMLKWWLLSQSCKCGVSYVTYTTLDATRFASSHMLPAIMACTLFMCNKTWASTAPYEACKVCMSPLLGLLLIGRLQVGPSVPFHGHAGINRGTTAFLDMLSSFQYGFFRNMLMTRVLVQLFLATWW